MKYFSRIEFECQCGCGFDVVDYELGEVLDELREHYKVPVTINSGCRCKAHNKAIGGAYNSTHTLGKAADVVVKDVPSDDVYEYLNSTYNHKYGVGKYVGRTHIDVRPTKARWDMT